MLTRGAYAERGHRVRRVLGGRPVYEMAWHVAQYARIGEYDAVLVMSAIA